MIVCTLDGLNLNNRTLYFMLQGFDPGEPPLTYDEFPSYDGSVVIRNASRAHVVQVALPIDVRAASEAALWAGIDAINAKIRLCTNDAPKTLVVRHAQLHHRGQRRGAARRRRALVRRRGPPLHRAEPEAMMASPVITTVSPEQPLVRSHGGKLNISWRDSLNVAAPARFGVWLVDLASNGWYGGWVFDADGSGAYSREIAAVGCPDNVPLSPVVYYAESPGAGWGGDSGSCYGFAPSTVTLLPFSVAAAEPAHAVAGTPVTVRGTGFTNGLTDVWFGPDAAPRCAVISDTEAIAYVPAGPAGQCAVYVTCDGQTIGYAPFIIDASPTGPAPNITSIDPSSAEPGEIVTISGSGLCDLISLTFGASAAAYDVVSDTELTVLVPRNEGTVMVTATNPYGSDTFEFTYPAQPVPTVASVAPAKGYPGDVVAITGTGFLTASGVSFGAIDAEFLVADDTIIMAYVPEGLPSGDCQVSVTGPGGASIEPVMFSVGAYNLPITTAVPVSSNAFAGWAQGPVTVTLTADPNGGPGIAKTLYVHDDSGIVEYAAPFVVSGAGSHHLIWWSVDVRGRIEPPQSGYVNILSAGVVPTGLTVTPIGAEAVLAKWDAIASERPVSYRLYAGPAGAGPWTLVAAITANIASVAQPAADGPRYYAAASVDVNGNESAKSAAVGPVAALAVTDFIPDGAVDAAMLEGAITASIAAAQADADAAQADAATAATAAATAQADAVAASLAAGAAQTYADTAAGTAAAAQADAVAAGIAAASAQTAAEAAATNTVTADRLVAGSITAAKLNVADVQAAVVTAAKVNALALSAGAITAGTLSADRIGANAITAAKLNVADVQAAIVTAARVNTLALDAAVIQAGIISTERLDAAAIQAAVVTAAKINTLALNASVIQAGTIGTDHLDANAIQAAVVTAAKINTLALSASVISAGTIDTARLNVAAIQAATVTASAVNALAISAGSITAGTLSADRIAGSSITAAKLDVASVQAAVVTAAAINAVTINAANITGGNISGVTLTGGTIRTTPTAAGKRIELSTDHTMKWYSGDAAETAPGTISAYTYSGGGGYMSLQGPRVSGMPMGAYISLHGAATRKDILLWGGSATVTIGDPTHPGQVDIGGACAVSGALTASGVLTASSGINAIGSTIGGIQLTGNVISGASDVQSSRFYTTANCASGTSADGVWINDLTTAARRWKLYMNGGQLYARYDSSGTGYKVIGP